MSEQKQINNVTKSMIFFLYIYKNAFTAELFEPRIVTRHLHWVYNLGKRQDGKLSASP